MSTDTNIDNLVINKLTKAQYEDLVDGGQINQNELYMIIDDYSDLEIVANKVTSINTTTPSTTKYPSESAVVTYVSGLVGNINTLLGGI